MKRRLFSFSALTAWGAASLAATGVRAVDATPVEGKDYSVLRAPVRENVPPHKIEVIEFFWYGCPHCYKAEPDVEAWITKLPHDVVFHRVPMMLRPVTRGHQVLFYALQAMGLVDSLHRKVFDAFHNGTFNPMAETPPETYADFLAKLGVDRQKFIDTYNSFSVKQVKVNEANRLAEAYNVTGVPTLAIGGIYVTQPAEPGPMLATANYLIGLARKKS